MGEFHWNGFVKMSLEDDVALTNVDCVFSTVANNTELRIEIDEALARGMHSYSVPATLLRKFSAALDVSSHLLAELYEENMTVIDESTKALKKNTKIPVVIASPDDTKTITSECPRCGNNSIEHLRVTMWCPSCGWSRIR